MGKLKIKDVIDYVETNIGNFHEKRIEGLKGLKLKTVLKKKNPYLFKAKNVHTAGDIVKGITDAFISSKEETLFGNWLEGFAIFVNEKVYYGRKSGIPGVDLEFDKEGIRYILSIKSGPNWGNDSQIKKLIDNFNSARKVLRTSGASINIIAINGCCYGKTARRYEYKAKGDYYKYCGQRFWEFISGDENLYLDIIEPLGNKSKERNEEFMITYAQKLNLFTKDFIDNFCLPNGEVDWTKLVKYNSEEKERIKRINDGML